MKGEKSGTNEIGKFTSAVKGYLYGRERYTQEVPILPEVWIAFGRLADHGEPDGRVDLLLTPYDGTDGSRLAENLKGEGRRVAHIFSYVAVSVTLKELVKEILPLTAWWADYKTSDNERTKHIGKRATVYQIISKLGSVFKLPAPGDNLIWQVALNRSAQLALFESVPTAKADAARGAFQH